MIDLTSLFTFLVKRLKKYLLESSPSLYHLLAVARSSLDPIRSMRLLFNCLKSSSLCIKSSLSSLETFCRESSPITKFKLLFMPLSSSRYLAFTLPMATFAEVLIHIFTYSRLTCGVHSCDLCSNISRKTSLSSFVPSGSISSLGSSLGTEIVL